MSQVYIVYKDHQTELVATNILLANNFLSRFKGLMFKDQLPHGSVLILSPCNSIHMFFMRFPIDVIYTDENFNVVRYKKRLKLWQIDIGNKKAKYTFEFPVNTIKGIPLKIILK